MYFRSVCSNKLRLNAKDREKALNKKYGYSFLYTLSLCVHFAKHNNTIERQRLNDEICANYTLLTTLFIVILKKMREDTKKESAYTITRARKIRNIHVTTMCI